MTVALFTVEGKVRLKSLEMAIKGCCSLPNVIRVGPTKEEKWTPTTYKENDDLFTIIIYITRNYYAVSTFVLLLYIKETKCFPVL